MEFFQTPVWIDKARKEEIKVSQATRESDYGAWNKCLQFYKDSLGTPDWSDYIKHEFNTLGAVFKDDKSSVVKNFSLVFGKKCPKSICLAMIGYMEKGMSEEQAYHHMILDLKANKYPDLEDI